jgi:hypothetical protein
MSLFSAIEIGETIVMPPVKNSTSDKVPIDGLKRAAFRVQVTGEKLAIQYWPSDVTALGHVTVRSNCMSMVGGRPTYDQIDAYPCADGPHTQKHTIIAYIVGNPLLYICFLLSYTTPSPQPLNITDRNCFGCQNILFQNYRRLFNYTTS